MESMDKAKKSLTEADDKHGDKIAEGRQKLRDGLDSLDGKNDDLR